MFQGDPAPTVTWLKDGQALSTAATVKILSYPTGVDGDHTVFSFLTLSPVTVTSTGMYQCEAINEKGAAVVDIGQLLGKRSPPAASVGG